MNKEIFKAIRFLNEHSLSVISTDRQINNETIMVQDDFTGTHYTIHKTGYARKRVRGWCGELNHYQLNKTTNVLEERTYYNGKVAVVETLKRILLPGDYVTLAGYVIKIANRERLKKKDEPIFYNRDK